MKPIRLMRSLIFASLFIACSVLANDKPELPVSIADFCIVPLALLVFAWSGAARLYDESHGTSGERIRMLILAVILTYIGTKDEGFAFLTAPFLCVYGLVIAFRMIEVSSLAPKYSLVQRASRWGGILLIPTVIFLAGFNFGFIRSHRFHRSDFVVSESLPTFYAYQRAYAAKHDGRFLELRIEDKARVEKANDESKKVWDESAMDELVEFCGTITQININYGADMKSYQIKTRPVAFYPWPYYLFSPRRSFFMKEDGVIHVARSWSSETEATENSPKY